MARCASALLLLLARSDSAGAQVLEVKDVPGPLAAKVEGLYTPWHARWINGHVWKRSNVGVDPKTGVHAPTYFGAICGHEQKPGPPTEWCFAECEEEWLMTHPGLLLPCDAPGVDGTACPPTPPPPPGTPPPRSLYCTILGHARKWHEAGFTLTAAPPSAEYWRWRLNKDDYVGGLDAQGLGFEVSFHQQLDEIAPGERMLLRRDGSLRSGAIPGFCLGPEKGKLTDGMRLVFWECGPHPHELMMFDRQGPTKFRMRNAQHLCVGVNGGKVASLVPCEGGYAETIMDFQSYSDGTVRAVGRPTLCLGSGSDRPWMGTVLVLEPCTQPTLPAVDDRKGALYHAAAESCAAKTLPGAPPPPDAGAGVQKPSEEELAERLWRSMEEKMAQKTDRLERELASLRESRGQETSMSEVLRALEAVGNSSVQGQELVSRTAQLEDEMARLRALVAQENARQRRAPTSRTKPCTNCD